MQNVGAQCIAPTWEDDLCPRAQCIAPLRICIFFHPKGRRALQVEHLTVTKMYVIIIPKRSGIYNIPIIPLVLTSTIFEKGKQEVNYCQDRYAHSGLYILLF